jgi:PilZ domain
MAIIDSREIERRRFVRTKLAVPLRLIGQKRTGEEFTVDALTHTVSDSGCLVHLDTVLFVEQPLELRNETTGQSIKGRVVSTWRHPEGKVFAGLEFASPSPGFWTGEPPISHTGDSLQPKQ